MTTRLWRSVALAVAVLCGTSIAPGQSTGAKDLGAGKLLVASRDLSDPNFVESVVLLIKYDRQGTLGLIINRRTKAPISRVLENLDAAKRGSDPVYLGGPVELTAVFGLFRSRKKPDDSATSVLGDVYLASSKALLEKTLATSSGPGDLRLYVGYCGWAPRQLENEVELGGWWIFDGSAGLVFDPYPDSMWSRLIARTEQQVARNRTGGWDVPPAPGSESPGIVTSSRVSHGRSQGR